MKNYGIFIALLLMSLSAEAFSFGGSSRNENESEFRPAVRTVFDQKGHALYAASRQSANNRFVNDNPTSDYDYLTAIRMASNLSGKVRKTGSNWNWCNPRNLFKRRDSHAVEGGEQERDANAGRGKASGWISSVFGNRGNAAPASGGMAQLALPRSAWNASEGGSVSKGLGRPVAITVHESEGDSSRCSSIRETVQKHHIAKGWQDIGYHFVICTDDNDKWVVMKGRKDTPDGQLALGSHAGDDESDPRISNNVGNIGVMIMGKYHVDESYTDANGKRRSRTKFLKDPDPEALAMLTKTVTTLKKDHPSISKLYSHSQLHRTKNGGGGCTSCMATYEGKLDALRSVAGLGGSNGPAGVGNLAGIEREVLRFFAWVKFKLYGYQV